MTLSGTDLEYYMKAASKPTTTTVFGPAPSPPPTIKALVWSSPGCFSNGWHGDTISYDELCQFSSYQHQVLTDLVRAGKWVFDPSLPGYREVKYSTYKTHNPSKTLTVADLKALSPAVSPIRSPTPSPATPTTPPAKAGGVRQNWSSHAPEDLASDKIPPLVRNVFPFPAEALKPFPFPKVTNVRFYYSGRTSTGGEYTYTVHTPLNISHMKYTFYFHDKSADLEVAFHEDCPVALGYRILFWLQET